MGYGTFTQIALGTSLLWILSTHLVLSYDLLCMRPRVFVELREIFKTYMPLWSTRNVMAEEQVIFKLLEAVVSGIEQCKFTFNIWDQIIIKYFNIILDALFVYLS